jgi:hypothetical protein
MTYNFTTAIFLHPVLQRYTILYCNNYCEFVGSQRVITYVLHFILLYVQVTVHRDKLRIKQPTRYIKYPKFILS